MDASVYEIVPFKGTSMLHIRNKSGGPTPNEIAGLYTKESLAKMALDGYVQKRNWYKYEETPLMALDKLSKKESLFEFAELMKIEIPAELKQPATIKKYIKEQLEV